MSPGNSFSLLLVLILIVLITVTILPPYHIVDAAAVSNLGNSAYPKYFYTLFLCYIVYCS